MPAPPDLGGREHALTTTYVTEGSLAGTVGTATGDTRDTRNCAFGTPRLGGGLVAGLLGDSVGLSAVLGDIGMDKIHNVRLYRGLHDIGEHNGSSTIDIHVAFKRLYRDQWTSGHRSSLMYDEVNN
ncbi:hypothetical protein ACOSP7_028590 [Xanthoceras sorbifolium]